jgi:hypothetical protein
MPKLRAEDRQLPMYRFAPRQLEQEMEQHRAKQLL